MQNTQSDKKPLVSFIITCYNLPAEMVGKCIGSITALSLSEHEREIIVIDDGSENNVLEGLSEYREHIIYIRKSNGGVSEARNTGIKMCSGEFIQFVDGDDWLISASYERCLDIVRFERPDMVLFNFTKGGKAASPIKDMGPVDGSEYMRHNNIRAAVWGYVFRHSILTGLRFTKGIAYGEDEEFTPQLIMRAERVFQTDVTAYYYRERETSAIHRREKRDITKRLNDIESVIFRLDDIANSVSVSNRTALRRRVAQLTMDYIYNVIMLTRSHSNLEKRIERLYGRGLFPLPEQNYTMKYRIFKRLVRSSAGRRVLLSVLPVINKE